MRQYIGARYVPILFNNKGSNEWVANMSYEPLTIVTYLNTSYTSVKTVPSNVGIPPQNPTYWVATGNYNAFMEQINQQIAEMQKTIDNIKPYNPNKYVVMIGDSYAYNNINWMKYVQQYLGLGNRCAMYAYPGYGFAHMFKSAVDQTFTQVSDPTEVTDVIFGGGYNDVKFLTAGNSLSSLVSSIQSTVAYAKQKYPNAKIWLSFLAWQTSSTLTNFNNANDFHNCYNAYRRFNQAMGGFMFGTEFSLHSPEFLDLTDGYHPNDLAQQVIASNMCQCLYGAYPSTLYTFNVNSNSAWVKSGSWTGGTLVFTVNNETTKLQNRGRLKFTDKTIGTGGGNLIEFTDNNVVMINPNLTYEATIAVTNSTGTVTLESGTLTFANNTIHLSIPKTAGTYTFEIYDIFFELPSMLTF